MIKAIFVDVDGVLKPYTMQNCIESFDIEAIKGIRMLEDRGISVCFASGKKTSYVKSCLNCSGLGGNGFIAGENGGMIINGSKPVVRYEKHIEDLQILRKAFPISMNKWKKFKKNGLEGWVMEEEKETGITILLSELDPKKFSEYVKDTISSMGINLEVMHGPSYVDIVQKGVSKSYALRAFSERTGINLKNIAGVGDEKNDISMLEIVGLPAAPSNAVSEVRGIVHKRGGYLANRPIGKGFLELCWYIIENRK